MKDFEALLAAWEHLKDTGAECRFGPAICAATGKSIVDLLRHLAGRQGVLEETIRRRFELVTAAPSLN